MEHPWEHSNACTVLVRRPEGKEPLRRHRHRLVDNIKIKW
jgi:hypothetical protein